MTDIPYYDKDGNIVNYITINDDVTYSEGRVSKGSNAFYKGAGIPYSGHYVEKVDFDEEEYIRLSNIFYMGKKVIKNSFRDKFGIFQLPYQIIFTDFIGACGVKELSIIENSELFERSSVDILDVVNFDKVNHQYYFKLNYKCDRKRYLTNGQPNELSNLIDYMLINDWNFPWDKNTITDISYNGLITDVADIFKSNTLTSKLGTVYSMLYSLGRTNFNKYIEFNTFNNLYHLDTSSFIFNSLELLRRSGIDLSLFYISDDKKINYEYIVKNFLITGRNCGDCCFIDKGNEIRTQYNKMTETTFKRL